MTDFPKCFPAFDPNLDLFFERKVAMDRKRIWSAWTEPELLKPWFCPKPWSVTECEIDLRAGGIFRTTMQSPDGMPVPNTGCYLEVVKEERLVWTNALGPGFRPIAAKPLDDDTQSSFYFTGMIFLKEIPEGTHYTAVVAHSTSEHRDTHAKMGFEQGWGIALDQLIAFMRDR